MVTIIIESVAVEIHLHCFVLLLNISCMYIYIQQPVADSNLLINFTHVFFFVNVVKIVILLIDGVLCYHFITITNQILY